MPQYTVVKAVPGKKNQFVARVKDYNSIVYCNHCKEWTPVINNITNIEEGDRGQDRATFVCVVCETESVSDMRRA